MLRRPLARSNAALAAFSILAAGSLSCTPPTTASTTPVAVIATSPGAAAPPSDEDISPVPEPKELAAVMRIGSPITDLVMLKDILPAHTDFGQLAALGPQGVVELTLGSLGKYVDVAAPLDMLSLDKDSSSLVASMVLRDFEQARKDTAGDFEFRQVNGRLLVIPRPRAKDTGLIGKTGLACEVARGGSPPVDHIICAGSEESLEIGAPYLARTVARQPAQVGLSIEMPEAWFRAAIAEERGKLDAATEEEDAAEAAGRQLGQELIDQFTDDFKDIGMGLKLGPSGVTAGLDLRFRSVTSLLSLALVGSRGSNVPATFWKLPADSDTAFYFPGAPADSMRPAGTKLWSDVAEKLPDEDLPREASREFCAAMAKLVFTGGPWIVAHGPPPKGAAPPEQGASFVKRFQQERQNVAGWLLYGVPEPASTWTATLRDLLRINAGSQKKGASSGGGAVSSGGAVSGGKKGSRNASRTLSTTKEVAIKPAEGLPAGAIHIVDHEVPNPAYKASVEKPALQAPVDTHLFAAGTGTDTWLVISENEALARTKLLEAMKGDAGGIGGRAELAPLRSLPAGGIGFTSMHAVAALLGGNETEVEISDAAAMLQAIAGLPSSGSTPVFLSLSPGPSSDKGGAALHISGQMPLTGVIDLVQWLQ